MILFTDLIWLEGKPGFTVILRRDDGRPGWAQACFGAEGWRWDWLDPFVAKHVETRLTTFEIQARLVDWHYEPIDVARAWVKHKRLGKRARRRIFGRIRCAPRT